MGPPRGVTANEAHTGEAAGELLLEDGEDFVAAEQVVPKLTDGLAVQRAEPWRHVRCLDGLGSARPHHPIGLASVRSDHVTSLWMVRIASRGIAGSALMDSSPADASPRRLEWLCMRSRQAEEERELDTAGAPARPAGSADAPTPALVFVTALAVVALQLATGWRYGVFRDELYYLACASHLDWGYVDHPPLSIVVLAGVRALLGDSLLALRVVPALLCGLLVWLASRLAREMGGGRFAQSLTAVAVAIAPQYLALTGFYSMNAFDLVFWALGALLVARLVRTEDVRLWRP